MLHFSKRLTITKLVKSLIVYMVGRLMRPLSASNALIYSAIVPMCGPVIITGIHVSDLQVPSDMRKNVAVQPATNVGIANMITDFQIELMLATGLLVWGYIVFVKLS